MFYPESWFSLGSALARELEFCLGFWWTFLILMPLLIVPGTPADGGSEVAADGGDGDSDGFAVADSAEPAAGDYNFELVVGVDSDGSGFVVSDGGGDAVDDSDDVDFERAVDESAADAAVESDDVAVAEG